MNAMNVRNVSFSAHVKLLALVLLTALCYQPVTVRADVDVDEVFKLLPFSADEKQKILNGEIIKTLPKESAERELAVGLGFLVKSNPEVIQDYYLHGKLIDTPKAVLNHRIIKSESDFKALTLTSGEQGEVQNFLDASPGDKLNLSAKEIAAFKALKEKGLSDTDANNQVLAQIQAMLLARYQAYKAGGVSAIAPYQREDGKQFKLGAYFQSITKMTPIMEKLFPKFRKILLEYPNVKDPALKEQFFLIKMNVEGRTAFVLTHRSSMEENGAHVIASRHFYASQSYNGQQEVGFLVPTNKGTLAVVLARISSEEVAGFGSSTKHFIGKRMLSNDMANFYKAIQKKVGK